MKETVFRLARYVPYVQREIAKAHDETMRSVYAGIAKSIGEHTFARALPEKGLSKVSRSIFLNQSVEDILQDELLEKLEQYRSLESISYSDGKVSGCVYKKTSTDTTEIYNTVIFNRKYLNFCKLSIQIKGFSIVR